MKIHNKCTAILIDSMGDDMRVANAARVSFDKWKDEFDASDEGLINYLARHKHWTPFGHVMLTMRLYMPMFVARQWIKSDVGCIRNDNGVENEVSRRYVDSDPEFYIPDEFHKRPDGGIKQGCGAVHPANESIKDGAYATCSNVFHVYKNRLQIGIAPEEARIFLPQNTMTTIVETGSLAYYARVCKLRLDSHAQSATRQLAQEVADLAVRIAPISWAALISDV